MLVARRTRICRIWLAAGRGRTNAESQANAILSVLTPSRASALLQWNRVQPMDRCAASQTSCAVALREHVIVTQGEDLAGIART